MKKSVPLNKIICCDVLEGLQNLPDQSVQCVVTSPPYFGLRNYKVEGQIGNEETLQEYIQNLVNVFQQVWRVLRDDGTVWLNLGDSYANTPNGNGGKTGSCFNGRDMSGNFDSGTTNKIKTSGLKQKDLMMVPARVAIALQEAGWYIRNEIIWAKSISFCKTYVGSCMPDSCRDRSTRSHEQIFLLTKKPKYFYDQKAIKEEGVWPAGTKAAKGSGTREGNRRGKGYATYSGKRNTRSVWAIPVKPYKEAHFATFPEALVEPCIKAGSKKGDIILDIFMGSGTTAVVAKKLGRDFIGFELNPSYIEIANKRIKKCES